MEKLATLPLEAQYDLLKNELFAQGKKVSFTARTLGEMKEVLFDAANAQGGQSKPLYFMFRDVHREQDKQLLDKHGLRYDVTSLPAIGLGPEFNKTYGHYHPLAPNSKTAYPELYEVLYGEAWYVLQKRKADANGLPAKGDELEEIIVVKAKAGDKVLMPPNYGHLTINPSLTQTLVMANLVEGSFKSDYSAFKQKKGGAYFALTDGTWKPNPAYVKSQQLKQTTAKEFWGNKPMHRFKDNTYSEFLKDPQAFEFLKKPELLF